MDIAPMQTGIYNHAAIVAAVTDQVSVGSIKGYMHQTVIFTIIDSCQGFFETHGLWGFYILM
jgi:hypothetical protein